MENIFLFTGENAYALQQELGRRLREFRERHGEENMTRLSAVDLTPSAFLNEIASSPFIAERRLVMIDGIPSFFTEESKTGRKFPKGIQGMSDLLKQVHPQVIVLFVAPKPDRRLASTKELLTLATVRAFSPLKGDALLRWMQEAFRAAGAQAGPSVLTALLHCVGEDQQMLSQEISKLALLAFGRPVSPRDVEALVLPSAEQKIWNLLDLLGEGRTEDAVLYCRQLLRSGESAQGIWPIFLWIVASLASVAAQASEGTTDIQSIMQATGVKFGAARALLPLARSCRKEQLRDLLARVADAEISLKTGAWKTDAASEEELCALLDRCVLSFPVARRT